MSEEEKPETKTNDFLTGRLLLAMPSMGDPRFHKAVILLCAHDENGAMGLVINHMLPGLDMSELMKQLNIDPDSSLNAATSNAPVFSGGPVETARGFILHSNDFSEQDTIQVNENLSVTGTVDALKAIATGDGPDNMLFILGYAGWSPGQLDTEIHENVWLVADPDPELIFSPNIESKWDAAVKKLGIDPGMLSSTAGRA
jgi:putative transcriptional regulator